MLLGYLKGWLVGVPSIVARNISLELWLGIGVKHVVFLELWLGLTSVAGVSVHVAACMNGSSEIALLSNN